MGLGTLGKDSTVFKRKFRWLFDIEGVSQGEGGSLPALPPKSGARPNISFNEIKVEHLTETIYYPGKPDWQTIELVLYDVTEDCKTNPVFEWLQLLYDPESGDYTPVVDAGYKDTATLTLFDGCGSPIETWTFENAYPQRIDWGTLDMDESDIVTVDLTLRYDRAFISEG